MGYNFGYVIASSIFEFRVVLKVTLYDKDKANLEVLRDIAMATIFCFLYMACTLAPPGEYD